MPRPLPGVSRIAFSKREAAGAIGVSPATVSRLIETGDLPIIRIARRVLIPRVALERWAEENVGHHFLPNGRAAAEKRN